MPTKYWLPLQPVGWLPMDSFQWATPIPRVRTRTRLDSLIYLPNKQDSRKNGFKERLKTRLSSAILSIS